MTAQPAEVVDLGSPGEADMGEDAELFEHSNLEGASLLLYPIMAEGREVTANDECVGALENPNMLEVVACWHPSHGWREPRHCVHEGYEGKTVTELASRAAQVTLGAPVTLCEREAMHYGYLVDSGSDRAGLMRVEGARPAGNMPCEVLSPESNARQALWLAERLEALDGGVLALVEHPQIADACKAELLGLSSTQLLERLEEELDAAEANLELSQILNFPHARAGQFEALRSASLRMCEADFVWGKKGGSWELIGFNDSMQFSSRIPFGDGLLDIARATCSDLDGNGSPELWIHSGYETMGGFSLIDMHDYAPETSKPLFTRYTGD